MKVIKSVEAWYPSFLVGGHPVCVPCQLQIVDCNDGKRYLRTPFAFLTAYDDDDADRQIGRGYYATEVECQEYLVREYPNWQLAEPIMRALSNAILHRGPMCGAWDVANRIGVSSDEVYKVARGQRGIPIKLIRQAAKLFERAR